MSFKEYKDINTIVIFRQYSSGTSRTIFEKIIILTKPRRAFEKVQVGKIVPAGSVKDHLRTTALELPFIAIPYSSTL